MKDIIKILFVEDAREDAELIWRQIIKDEILFEKELVEKEQDYIMALDRFRPDLIISDYSLPQFDGLTALNIKNKLAYYIPFILVTGSMNEETAVELMKAGADDYVIKQNLSRLGGAIRSAVSKMEAFRIKEAAETALRESEERFHRAVENSPVPIMIHDEDGKVLLLSKGWTQYSGYSISDIPTLDAWTKAAYGDRNGTEKDYIDKLFDIKETENNGERLIRTKNGDTRIWNFHTTPLGRVSMGKRVLQSLATDITESRKMQNKLIESEAYYRTLIDISPDGIIITDPEGRITYGSIKARAIFDIPAKTFPAGTQLTDWVMPENRQKAKDRFAGIISGNTVPATNEYLLRKSNGDPFWAEISSTQLKDREGKTSGVVIVCRDISEKKKILEELISARDRAEENDRLKTAFLHNISHEIRTPLNAIIGFSTLMAEPGQTEDARASYSEIIINSSNHLLKVVSDIIEISSIEAGVLNYKREIFNLNAQLAALYRQYNKQASEKGLILNYMTRLCDEEAVVETDLSKLMTILTSLLNNAFKFTHEGLIEFGCELADGFLRFHVSDTGIGISEDQQLKIFERFYQVEHTASRSYEGAGLGLSISKAYAEFLGGRIWVESKMGKGSLFVVTLPYKKAPVRKTELREKLSYFKTKAAFSKTIPVAGDNDRNRRNQ